ncbi:glycosyl hydrolase [Bifidobacterium hapali]|uniref:beta-N-acetylhexosaminidase n=1 Tax=Bifidobacterium hapali TaxID=1630172 RepID=A0A261FVM1_9BIFI|nr:glycoside hydrolase family 20 zincin-like fold domain-containing protein [Bifidobacterium hapali]OZG63219.1 glycosyl hydrolase [Bifidobacterium hapali]
MQYYVEGDAREFELIPQPRTVSIDRDAPAVMLPYVGRIVENAGDADATNVWAEQIADDIEAATGLRWDVAKGDRWQSFITLSIEPAGVTASPACDDIAAEIVPTNEYSADTGTISTFSTHATVANPTEPHASNDSSAQQHNELAYRLTIAPTGITVTATTAAGLRDGVQTLRQIIRQCVPALPQLTIDDQPTYATRGYYLDATRGRVPTLDWLKRWADKLCLYKYNQLQLYIEHTFAFDNMSETWRGASPLKPADIIAFDDYCDKRGIELVPSVSTFGHHYMALRTHELRHLGEFPEQADRTYSFIERMEHHTLNITEPDALALSFKLIDDYLELFHTRKFNICGDETFDLGKGRSKPEADRRGVAAMYADYVTRLCRHLSEQGREPLFWGDIAVEMPEILGMLPKGVMLLNWLYTPQITDEKVRLVDDSGAQQYVCPAVWCWNALLPRIDWAWENIARLARYGAQYGAAGFLVTDWGDFGHVNDPRMAIPGMIYGAQCAWDPDWAASVAGGCGCGAADGAARSERAHVELDRRISIVEYGDRTSSFVAALRDASHQVTFGWDNIVRYLELDLGDGSLNEDVRNTIWTDETEHAARIHASTTLDEARANLLAWLAPDIVRWREANAALDAAAARLGVASANAVQYEAADSRANRLQPILVAIEGQRLFNELGACLAVRAEVVSADDAGLAGLAACGCGSGAGESTPGSANAPIGTLDNSTCASSDPTRVPSDPTLPSSDPAQRVARDLERWFETYADVWRTVSTESELRRIANVIWRCADLLRAA